MLRVKKKPHHSHSSHKDCKMRGGKTKRMRTEVEKNAHEFKKTPGVQKGCEMKNGVISFQVID